MISVAERTKEAEYGSHPAAKLTFTLIRILIPLTILVAIFNSYLFSSSYLFGFAEWYSPYSVGHLRDLTFNSLFLYSDNNWGVATFYPTVNILYIAQLGLAELFGLMVSQKILIVSLFYANFVGCYLFLRSFETPRKFPYVASRRVAYLLSLFFMMNPFVVNHFLFGHLVLIWDSASLLFFGFFCSRYFRTHSVRNLFFAGIVMGLSPLNPLYIPFFVFVFAIQALFFRTDRRHVLIAALLAFGTFFAVDASWLLNLVVNRGAINSTISYRIGNVSNIRLQLREQSQSFANSFLNSIYVNKVLFLDNKRIPQVIYDLATLVLWIWTTLMLSRVRFQSRYRQSFFRILLLVCLLLMIILAGTYNLPLVVTVLMNLGIYKIYTEIYHFTLPMEVAFSLLIFLLATSTRTLIRISIVVLGVVTLLRTGAIASVSQARNVFSQLYSWNSYELSQNAAFYARMCSKYRTAQYVLYVPFYPNVYNSVVAGKNLQGGADALLSEGCSATVGNWVPLNTPFSQAVHLLSSKSITQSDIRFFTNAGVKYVVFRKAFRSSNESLYNSERLLRLVQNDSHFVLLENKSTDEVFLNTYDNGLITARDTQYVKVNPTTFEIRIRNMGPQATLKFMELFSKNWALFPSSFGWSSNACSRTGGCTNLRELDPGTIARLFEKPVFSDTHQTAGGYGNEWELSKSYIEKNFPKYAYSVNPDGTINVKLELYYQPQSYFYLGGLIGVIWVISWIFAILYATLVRRRRLSEHVQSLLVGSK